MQNDIETKPVKYVTPSRRIFVTYRNPYWENDEFLISEEDYNRAEAFLRSPHKFSIIPKTSQKQNFNKKMPVHEENKECTQISVEADVG